MGQKAPAPPFDTQRAVEELIAAGMPPDQAGVIARLHLRWADRDFATREEVELRIDARFETLERKIDACFAALEAKIAQSAADTTKWVIGLQVGTTVLYLAALLAAIKL